jgi:hypothetical protein
VCGKYGSLWPRPTIKTEIGAKLAIFHIDDLAVKFDTSRLVSIEVSYILSLSSITLCFIYMHFHYVYFVFGLTLIRLILNFLEQEDVIEHLELILSDAWINFTEYLRQMIDNLKKKGPSAPVPSARNTNKHFER